MPDRTPPVSLLLVSWLMACGATAPEPPPQPEIPERCRAVHLDKLAETDWVGVHGNAADPKTRMRVTVAGDGYEAAYVSNGFTKLRLRGEKRDKDVRFTEVPDGAKAARVAKGEAALARIYVVPKMEKCGLEVIAGTVDKSDKESIPPKGTEMAAFPKKEGVEFTYLPADRTLFLGKAAQDRGVADQQLAAGGADPAYPYGDVPVGVFTRADDDGAADCTFDMDLYFDDRNVPDLAGLPAGEVKDGWRHWFHLWKAPYSGNHHFEMYRYRTCGGARTLVDVAAIEAVLE